MGTRAEDSLIGQTLDGRYRIEKILGVGGMGAVYRARHIHFDTPIAVKVMRSSEADAARRFLAEARRTFRLKHPNCVDVSDCGVVDGGALLYLTMELLEGRTLGEELERDGAMDPFRAAHVGAQVAAAIGAAHELGYVHRDLKPDNIMLLHRGADPDFVKVLDFGLAKLYDAARLENTRSVMSFTQDGLIFGTPHYMSPEQAQGFKLDPRSDLYSLGVVLYEALTGEVPFDSEAQVEILIAHVQKQPRKLTALRKGLPPALVAVVHELLRKDPDSRPASATRVSEALAALNQPSSPAARVPSKLASSETIQLAPAAPSVPPHALPTQAMPAPSVPPEHPTALTRPLGPHELAAVRPRSRVPLIIAVLLGLFGAGALLAWGLDRGRSPAVASSDASAIAAGDNGADSSPAAVADAAPTWADASPMIDAAIETALDAAPARPRLTASQKQARALMRRWRQTSSPLKRMALAQQAFEADRSYTEARFAFADALLGTDVPKNRTRACKLLRGFKSRFRRAGCSD